jgi:rod shape-determining protein MreB
LFRFLKPELLIGVPAGITFTEKRAVIEAGLLAGARACYTAQEPILAALGADIPIDSCFGNMVVDIGAGTSEIAVISLGGIVTCRSIRVGGDKIDLDLADYIKKKYNLAIGEQTAEEIKIKIGAALPSAENMVLEVRGRDLISGLPQTVKISSNEVAEAISATLAEIIQAIKIVLRETPPELSADIIDKGMVLSGGGALLRGLSEKISEETGVPCFVAGEPLLCVARGTGIILGNLDLYKRSIMIKK